MKPFVLTLSHLHRRTVLMLLWTYPAEGGGTQSCQLDTNWPNMQKKWLIWLVWNLTSGSEYLYFYKCITFFLISSEHAEGATTNMATTMAFRLNFIHMLHLTPPAGKCTRYRKLLMDFFLKPPQFLNIDPILVQFRFDQLDQTKCRRWNSRRSLTLSSSRC